MCQSRHRQNNLAVLTAGGCRAPPLLREVVLVVYLPGSCEFGGCVKRDSSRGLRPDMRWDWEEVEGIVETVEENSGSPESPPIDVGDWELEHACLMVCKSRG